MSFNDKKKADIVIVDAIMNLMTTRQRDNEDLTNYTKCFKVVRDLCNKKYGGIFKIPTLAQRESTWACDQEGSYKTAYACFLSALYLKNMEQMKYSSFIKKMAEDFAKGWENIYPTHITENVAKDTFKGSLFDCQENVSHYTYYCLNNQCEY